MNLVLSVFLRKPLGVYVNVPHCVPTLTITFRTRARRFLRCIPSQVCFEPLLELYAQVCEYHWHWRTIAQLESDHASDAPCLHE
jgi:hypothetical protein